MNKKIVIFVVLSCVVTFFLSVIFSINMVSISPKNLVKVIEKEPLTFFEGLETASMKAKDMKTKQDLKEKFENPVEIDTKGRVSFGDPKAPITVVEYSDFQCPYCQKAAFSLKALIKKYDGKVKVVYKHFPLSFHPFARPAANYYEAVALISEEKAREFHDFIFDNFQDYGGLQDKAKIEAELKKILTKIKVDPLAVEKNMAKGKAQVDADLKEAEGFKVNSTPSFFVNGIETRQLTVVIDEILKREKIL